MLRVPAIPLMVLLPPRRVHTPSPLLVMVLMVEQPLPKLLPITILSPSAVTAIHALATPLLAGTPRLMVVVLATATEPHTPWEQGTSLSMRSG